jgi:hypothetical protein
MHPLGSLIVELETAQRKLRKVFEVPNGTTTSEGRTRRIFNGLELIDPLLRPKPRWKSFDKANRFLSDNARSQRIALP